jgi:hypothetical protein
VFMSRRQEVLAATIENGLCSCLVNRMLAARIENGLCSCLVGRKC